MVSTLRVKNISAHELNEDAEKLIERFQRGDASRLTGDAGLGLAIVGSMVKLHNGEYQPLLMEICLK
jgi:signal transduction histidine kinase